MKTIQLLLFALGFLVKGFAQQPNPNPEVNYDVVHLRDSQDPVSNAFKHLGGDEVQLLHGYGASPNSTQFSHIKIDPNAVAPVPPNIGAPFTEADFDSQTIDVSLPVGYTPGSHGVSPTGAATYSIPIQLPPGTNGMVPSLSINYNSQSGNGLLGMGWSLGGLSAITRVPKTIYHDGEFEGVRFTVNDHYALDGNRLIVTNGGDYGADGTEYGTEMETFSKVISHGYHFSGDGGPEWFEVFTKDGRRIEFGRTDDSKFWTEPPAWNNPSGGGVIAYKVNRIEDQFKNYIEFEYLNDGRESRIKQIRYTGNENEGVDPYNIIQFHYQERADKNKLFVSGASVEQNTLLRKISITADGSHFKNYEFEYGVELLSFLKSVKEFGANGEELNPTLFKYGETSKELAINETNLSSEDNQWFYPGDFNGDGLTDLVEVTREQSNLNTGRQRFHTALRLKIGNGQETFTQVDLVDRSSMLIYQLTVAGGTTTHESKVHSTARVMDFTGDGKSDFLIVDKYAHNASPLFQGADRIRIFSFDGTSFVETNFAPPEPISLSTDIQTGDFDGDGVGDILLDLGSNNDTYVVYPKHGTTFFPVGLPDLSGSARHLVVDHNGDGRSDVMYITPDGYSSSIWTINGSVGGATAQILYESMDFPVSAHRIFPGDFNGDGKTDLLNYEASTGSWTINLSTGIDFNSYEFYLSPSVDFTSDIQEFTTGDFNGDGRTDILHIADNLNTSTSDRHAIVYYARAFGFDNNPIGSSPTISPFWDEASSFSRYVSYPFSNELVNEDPYFDSDDYHFHLIPTLVPGDYNGDGMTELLVRSNDGSLEHSLFRFGTNNKGFLLEGVRDGIGETVGFDYGFPPQSNYTDTWFWYEHSDYPNNGFIAALPMVRSVTLPDGIGGEGSVHYQYGDGLLNKEGKGLLGFKSILVRNDLINRSTTSLFELDNDFPILKPVSVKIEAYGGQDISDQTFNQEVVDRGNLRFWHRNNGTTTVNHLTGGTTTNSLLYYGDGNVNLSTTNNGAQTVVEHFVYTDCGTWFIPNRVEYTESTVTRGSSSYYRYKNHQYNPDGSIQSTTTDQGVTTNYTYDGFGNVTSSSTSASGVPSLSANYEFDPKGRFVISSENTLGQETTYTYDNRWGKILTTTGATGLTSSFQYNGFGQLTSATDELGHTSVTNRVWDNGTVPNSVFYVEALSPGAPPSKAWFDLFGRELKTETVSLGQQIVSASVSYDSRGRVDAETSTDALGGSLSTSYGYDSFGRVDQISGPTSTIQYGYQGSGGLLTTTTTNIATQQTSSKTTDAAGLTTKAQDAGGILNYDYHASGQLESVELVGQSENPATMTYNDWGYQESLTDANAGTSTYEYNNYGELTSQTVNGYEFVSTYDALGRVLTKTGPKLRYDQNGSVEVDGTGAPMTENGVTTYHYYTNGGGLNQIKKVSSDNGTSVDYEYDDYGRLTSEKETVDSRSFETTYSYDGHGRVSSVTYPGGLTINYVYDSNGYMTGVTSGSTSIYTMDAANALGQVTQYTLGNGKSTTNYYTNLGLPEGSSTDGVQELITHFNSATGNLMLREDALDNDLAESFTYDNLDRLETTVYEGQAIYPNIPDVVVDYSQDNNGNIQSKSDGGVYEYYTARPNAIKSVSNVPENISQKRQKIVYAPDGRRVASIVESSDAQEDHYEAVFLYGPDRNRKRMLMREKDANGDLQTLYTKHYSGAYEEIAFEGGDTYQLSYISGPEGLCAIHVHNTTSGEASFYYPYTDHLGSILTLTDDQGNVVGKQSFDAWGRYRDPNTWQLLDADPSSGGVFANGDIDMPIWLHRGYTGHEHMAYFDLINMNGRFYDPIPARMLSPDNYVQAGGFSQGYNRYSYAFNNPLKYTDPNGELVWLAPVAGALIGGAINVATNWNSIDNIGEGLVAFGAGAASGALASFGLGGALAGGALVGAANSIIGQTGNGKNLTDVNWGQVGVSSAVGMFASAAGYGASKFASKKLGGFVLNKLHIHGNSALGGLFSGALGGAAGGYVGGFTAGLLLTGDVKKANQYGIQGMSMGAGIGATTGFVTGMISAHGNGRNLLTGRPLKSVAIGRDMNNWVNPNAKELGAETITPEWNKTMKGMNDNTLMNRITGRGFNHDWYKAKLQQKYHSYDLGYPPNSSGMKPSLNYSLEQGLNYDFNYQNVHPTSTYQFGNITIYRIH